MRNMMRDAGNVENKEKQYTVVAWICLSLALLFQGSARNVPGFADWYAHHIYPLIVGSVGECLGGFRFLSLSLESM